MADPARNVYHYMVQDLASTQPNLMPTWLSHSFLPVPANDHQPQLPQEGRRHVVHRHTRVAIRNIAALGARMNQDEQRILRCFLNFLQFPAEAMRNIRFGNRETRAAIIERCIEMVLIYEPLINRALRAAANANPQPRAPELLNVQPEVNEPRNNLAVDANPQPDQYRHPEEPRGLPNYLPAEDRTRTEANPHQRTTRVALQQPDNLMALVENANNQQDEPEQAEDQPEERVEAQGDLLTLNRQQQEEANFLADNEEFQTMDTTHLLDYLDDSRVTQKHSK